MGFVTSNSHFKAALRRIRQVNSQRTEQEVISIPLNIFHPSFFDCRSDQARKAENRRSEDGHIGCWGGQRVSAAGDVFEIKFCNVVADMLCDWSSHRRCRRRADPRAVMCLFAVEAKHNDMKSPSPSRRSLNSFFVSWSLKKPRT